MRINRYIARSGVTSRRKAEELIKSEKVLVNNIIETDLSRDISDTDVVNVNGKIIKLPDYQYYILNKPVGYTTTREDIHAKKNVFELLPNEASLFTVGRLDKNTSGLLLVTNDGDFAQNIIHPSKKVNKVYEVITEKDIDNKQIDELSNPIKLNDGTVNILALKKISNRKIIITICVGKNRIVRRIFESIGNNVKELNRVQVGKIKLDIEYGKFRKLTEEENKYYV